MSSGNIVTGVPPHNYESRVWSGTDGKYEIVDNIQRTKMNSYNCTKERVESTPWVDTSFNPPRSFYMGEAGSPVVFDNNDSVKILSKLATKVRDTELDLGNYLVEGKQSLNTIRHGILTVGGALIDLKRGQFSKAARRLGVNKTTTKLGLTDLAGRWLELVYGWSPIIDDVYSAAKALESLTEKQRSKVYRVGTFKQVRFDGSNSPANYTCAAVTTKIQKLVFEVSEDLSVKHKLGLDDPAGILWEGLPYSFVIDWFLPIGDYLNAINTIPKLKGRWAWTKVRINDYPSFTVVSKTDWKGAKRRSKFMYISRTVGTGFPATHIPFPTFKTIDEASSPIHIANAIALVYQRLHGTSHAIQGMRS